MLLSRRAAVLCALTSTALAAGCAGSTEPAVDVAPDAATLVGRGSTGDVPAFTYFEYRRALGGNPVQTPRRTWPARVSGPVRERVTGLSEATPYGVRLCGGDQGQEPVCAQDRVFTTRGPAGEDSAIGSWRHVIGGMQPEGHVRAVADPAGEAPTGSLSFLDRVGENGLIRFTGFVTCLAVEGDRATVGAVGVDDATGAPTTALVTVVDRNRTDLSRQDLLAVTWAPGRTAPDCARGPAATATVAYGFVTVTDEPSD